MDALGIAFVVVVVVAFVALAYAARRALTLCEMRAEGGNLVVVRGGLAPSVLGDLRDVVRRDRLHGVRIRVVRNQGRAHVETSGHVDPGTLQRLRNVVGTVPYAKLVAGARS